MQRTWPVCDPGRVGWHHVFDKAIKVANVGKLLTEKQIALRVLDQNRWKVFDVVVIQQMGVIFDIDPDESMLRPLCAQLGKFRLVITAGIAPGGAIAGDKQTCGVLEPVMQCRQVAGIKYSHKGNKNRRVCL